MSVPDRWTKMEDDREGGLNYIYPNGEVIHVTKEEIHDEIFGQSGAGLGSVGEVE